MNGTDELADQILAQARDDEAASYDAARALEQEADRTAQEVYNRAVDDHLRRRRETEPGMRFGADQDAEPGEAESFDRPVAASPGAAQPTSPDDEFDDDDENGGDLRRGWLR